jgi:hypothetical protein
MQIDPSLFYSLTLLSKSTGPAHSSATRKKKKKEKEKERGVWGVPPHSQALFGSLDDDTTKEDAEIASIHDGT